MSKFLAIIEMGKLKNAIDEAEAQRDHKHSIDSDDYRVEDDIIKLDDSLERFETVFSENFPDYIQQYI